LIVLLAVGSPLPFLLLPSEPFFPPSAPLTPSVHSASHLASWREAGKEGVAGRGDGRKASGEEEKGVRVVHGGTLCALAQMREGRTHVDAATLFWRR